MSENDTDKQLGELVGEVVVALVAVQLADELDDQREDRHRQHEGREQQVQLRQHPDRDAAARRPGSGGRSSSTYGFSRSALALAAASSCWACTRGVVCAWSERSGAWYSVLRTKRTMPTVAASASATASADATAISGVQRGVHCAASFRRRCCCICAHVGDDRPAVGRRDRPAVGRHQALAVGDDVEDVPVAAFSTFGSCIDVVGTPPRWERTPLPSPRGSWQGWQ